MQTTAKQTKGALQLKEISIIPITTAAVSQPPADKASSSSMADDDSADSLRKKRCTDRYDSSESSDRYVPRVSFIKRFREDYRMSLRGLKVLISLNELPRTLSPAKTFKKLSIISFADLSILQATREQKSFLEAQADELKSRIHRSVQLSFGASITIKRNEHRGNLRWRRENKSEKCIKTTAMEEDEGIFPSSRRSPGLAFRMRVEMSLGWDLISSRFIIRGY